MVSSRLACGSGADSLAAPRRNWSRGAAAASIAVALLLAMVHWAPASGAAVTHALIQILEARFERADIADPATLTGVIALGGDDERIRETGRLARRFPHLRIFISGAGPRASIQSLLGEGIDEDRIEFENASHNTFQNALFATQLIAPKPNQRWLLVTSPFHMPRAVGAFQRRGFAVEPWPTIAPPLTPPPGLENARHEWLGLVAYWMLGRTSEIFPAARPRAPQQASAQIGGLLF